LVVVRSVTGDRHQFYSGTFKRRYNHYPS